VTEESIDEILDWRDEEAEAREAELVPLRAVISEDREERRDESAVAREEAREVPSERTDDANEAGTLVAVVMAPPTADVAVVIAPAASDVAVLKAPPTAEVMVPKRPCPETVEARAKRATFLNCMFAVVWVVVVVCCFGWEVVGERPSSERTFIEKIQVN
jgi:hypothetical protein